MIKQETVWYYSPGKDPICRCVESLIILGIDKNTIKSVTAISRLEARKKINNDKDKSSQTGG